MKIITQLTYQLSELKIDDSLKDLFFCLGCNAEEFLLEVLAKITDLPIRPSKDPGFVVLQPKQQPFHGQEKMNHFLADDERLIFFEADCFQLK